MKGYCKDCAAFSESVGGWGDCHRHPPRPMSPDTDIWPTVVHTDWCLDHTPKPNSPDNANNDPVDGDNSAEVTK